jgi:hypothetical protein
MNMARYARQHWVPQSYLRRFSYNGSHVWVFDKPTGGWFRNNVKDVARARFFNDSFLRDDTGKITPEVPEGWVEDRYGEWEKNLGAMTDVALRVANGGGASLEERATMAACVALQLTRTPAFRQRFTSGLIASLEEDANAYMAEMRPDLAAEFRATLSFPPEWYAAVHHQFIWTSGEVPAIAEDLYRYIWRIGVNVSAMPLCTSDTPVVQFIHDAIMPKAEAPAGDDADDIVRRVFVGDRPFTGIEVVFPLTPHVALLMYHPVHFAWMYPAQGHILRLSHARVLHYNALQLLDCERQVYSRENVFEEVSHLAATYVPIDHG